MGGGMHRGGVSVSCLEEYNSIRKGSATPRRHSAVGGAFLVARNHLKKQPQNPTYCTQFARGTLPMIVHRTSYQCRTLLFVALS